MIVSGNVPYNYPNIRNGINSLINSGLADPLVTGYYLYVNEGYYTGVFSASIPNGGEFYLIGNNSYFSPQGTCYISGLFNLQNINILGEDFNSWLFNISGNSTLRLNKSNIISCLYGCLGNSGLFELDDSYIVGSGVGIGFSGYNISLNNSKISNLTNGIISDNSELTNSLVNNCTNAINLNKSGVVFISGSLLHSNTYGIFRRPATTVNIYQSTIDSNFPIFGNSGIVFCDRSIIKGTVVCISGYLDSGSTVYNTIMYPSGWHSSVSNIPTSSGISNINPNFNNTLIGDFRLKFSYTNGSPAVSYIPLGQPSGVSLQCEISNVVLINNEGIIKNNKFQNFLYTQNGTIKASDYNKEVEFAHFIRNKPNLKFVTTTLAKFTSYDNSVTSCFSVDGDHPEPFDWDLKTFSSPEIVDSPTDLQYVIPRTYIDLKPIVETNLGFLGIGIRVAYERFSKTNIKVFNKQDSRGISYDYDLTEPGKSILWSIEGRNQVLNKRNAFTGEVLESFPLLCPSMELNNVTRVSGLIYTNQIDNKFQFIRISDSNTYIGESSLGHFKWVDTSLNTQYDVRGILAYKNSIYITATQYDEDIFNRMSIYEVGGIGNLIRYNNNDKPFHYLTSENNLGLRKMVLDSSNRLPTDITIYEDGSLLISDYSNCSGCYRYKFAHDYAIVEDHYNRLSKISLREDYSDVNF